jgi:hypothetical protein
MSNLYEQRRQAIMGGLPIDNAVSFDQFQDARLSGLVNSLQPNPQLMNNMSNVSQQINQEQIDKNAKEQKRKERRQGLEDIATRFGIINAQQSGNYQQANVMQNNLLQRQQTREAEAKLQEALANMSPDQLAIYNEAVALGGPVAGYNALQSVRNAEITALQKQREAQALRDAGRDEREISLFTDTDLSFDEILKLTGPSEDQEQIDALLGVGYTPEEANAIAVGGLDPDDIYKNNKILSNENIIKNVNNNVNKYLEDSKVQDTYANINEAFGPIDGLQSALTTVTNPFGVVVEGETNEAVNARTNLNNEIRANLVDDYSGRPNVFLLTQIEKLLPTSSFIAEFDAMQRYALIKNSFDSMIVQLEAGINGNLLSDATKQQYADDLYKTKIVQAKLEAAIKGLEKDKKVSLEQVNENFSSTGKYNNFYLEE